MASLIISGPYFWSGIARPGPTLLPPMLKRSKISETRDAMPTKIGFHAFHVNLYLHEFFEAIPFFDPHGL